MNFNIDWYNPKRIVKISSVNEKRFYKMKDAYNYEFDEKGHLILEGIKFYFDIIFDYFDNNGIREKIRIEDKYEIHGESEQNLEKYNSIISEKRIKIIQEIKDFG